MGGIKVNLSPKDEKLCLNIISKTKSNKNFQNMKKFKEGLENF